jgi:DNA-binding NarL/FixJ family response regulator
MNPTIIRAVLVDDQVLYRDALRTLFEPDASLQVVGDAGSGEEAVALCAKLAPDVVLMDLRMPGLSGVEATRLILEQRPSTKVLVLTTFDEEERRFAILGGWESGG